MEYGDRRLFLGMIGGFAIMGAIGRADAATGPAKGFVMWHSPGCGCCLEWKKRVETAFGRSLAVVETADIEKVKRAQGVPADLRSCHTALIHDYVVEGHVPPADIRRLIASRSRKVRGLAVPSMPVGAPGMESGGNFAQPYKVIAFGPGAARSVFARYG